MADDIFLSILVRQQRNFDMIDLYNEKELKAHLPEIDEKQMSEEEVLAECKQLKKELADQLVILGHHYQQDDVIEFADITGDSLQLAQEAKKLDKKHIIFCGVHFMAETADMVTTDEKIVILPDMKAGCSMADMANRKEIDKSLSLIHI